ncbi:MAG TPA: response regulator [bacterium]
MESRQVLIVEDDAPFVELLKLTLRDFQFQFNIAKDGLSALELLNKRRYDLLICDYRLPKVDGRDIIRLARAKNPECHIVLLSAANVDMIDAEIKQLPRFGFLQKPVSPSQLRKEVEKVFPN